MKITLLGANGKTGIQVVEQALKAGDTVNALIRSGDSLPKKPNLNVFIGDATNTDDIVSASKGSDVIISVLGPGSTKSQLMTRAIEAVIAASPKTDVKRFILMSSFAVKTDHLRTDAKLMVKMMQDVIADKAKSESLLKKSNLDWTIVYATLLADGPRSSSARVVPETEKIGLGHKIARADVAAWMLKEAKKNEYIKSEVIISSQK